MRRTTEEVRMQWYWAGRRGINPNTFRSLCRDAARLRSLAERDCNVGLTEKETKRRDAIENRIANSVADLDGMWTVEFSGDPRGSVARLIDPDGRSMHLD